jgi:hypothetical protein
MTTLAGVNATGLDRPPDHTRPMATSIAGMPRLASARQQPHLPRPVQTAPCYTIRSGAVRGRRSPPPRPGGLPVPTPTASGLFSTGLRVRVWKSRESRPPGRVFSYPMPLPIASGGYSSSHHACAEILVFSGAERHRFATLSNGVC